MQNIKLSELVKNHPEATIFLNEHHIDYCCRGDHFLYESLEEQGYEIEPFLEELEAFTTEQKEKHSAVIADDVYMIGVHDLITHLEATHHKDERALLSSIDGNLLALLSAHYARHKDELREVYTLFSTLRSELMLHFAQEEVEVFPLMQREATKKAYEKVVSLESDHEAAGDLIKRLINATHDFTAPVDGCATYRATYALLKQLVEDIFLHIYKENSILFPMYAEGVNA